MVHDTKILRIILLPAILMTDGVDNFVCLDLEDDSKLTSLLCSISARILQFVKLDETVLRIPFAPLTRTQSCFIDSGLIFYTFYYKYAGHTLVGCSFVGLLLLVENCTGWVFHLVKAQHISLFKSH